MKIRRAEGEAAVAAERRVVAAHVVEVERRRLFVAARCRGVEIVCGRVGRRGRGKAEAGGVGDSGRRHPFGAICQGGRRLDGPIVDVVVVVIGGGGVGRHQGVDGRVQHAEGRHKHVDGRVVVVIVFVPHPVVVVRHVVGVEADGRQGQEGLGPGRRRGRTVGLVGAGRLPGQEGGAGGGGRLFQVGAAVEKLAGVVVVGGHGGLDGRGGAAAVRWNGAKSFIHSFIH